MLIFSFPGFCFRLAILAFIIVPIGAAETTRNSSAERGYHLHPGLVMTRFVAEPDIVDPVALTFDEDGRMYVVEMRDYPLGIGSEHRTGGTVRLIEDTNNDGKIDKATLFAEGLSYPTSVAPWNGGILVTAPPEVIFLKDTNRDGKADVREIILQGFTLGVTDSNVNGLRWGLDNRLHGVNGGNGGDVTSMRQGEARTPLRNLDFSLDPASGDFRTTFHTSGGFGLVFDHWGHSFTTYNINHIQHRVIPERYLHRFQGIPPIEATTSISDHGDMARIYPISRAETRVNHPEQAGHFSSAGGMGFIGLFPEVPGRLTSIARGRAVPRYPGNLLGSILVCDVVGNLVHRDLIEEFGPSFVAKRSPDEQRGEFFASLDNAFRPTGVELGPDGALYLIDMQRDVIEHPDYIPHKVKAKLDLRAGENRGRIYRITPKGGPPFRRPALSKTSTAGLVRELANPSQWWRATAQRLLVQRQDKTAVPALREMAASRRVPLGRLHSLWTLSGLGSLDDNTMLKGLADENPGVRENALLLAENSLPGTKALRTKILALAQDPHPRVRFQAALTLGNIDDPQTTDALLSILRRDHPYRWTRIAVLSSVRTAEAYLLQSLLADAGFCSPLTESKVELIGELADLIGARSAANQTDGIVRVLSSLVESRPDFRITEAVLTGLQSGIERGPGPFAASAVLGQAIANLFSNGSPSLMSATWKLARTMRLPETQSQRDALAEAQRLALDMAQIDAIRLENIKLLGLGDFQTVGKTLFSLLEGTQTSMIQTAALEALRTFNELEVGKTLVERWRFLTPSVRPPVINLLLQRLMFHSVLLDAIEADKIKLGELNLDLEQRRLLQRESSPEVKSRAAKLFGDEEYSNRRTLADDWLNRMPAMGNTTRGRMVFEKACSACHVVGNLGHQVGPELSDVSHRSVEDLLFNILDPNMAIHPGYVSYTVELKTGELETGILGGETPETITLLQANGKKLIVPRKQLARMQSSGLSLMPEGLENGLSPADIRDLISFLQERR
jgi:putative membrane-bound dehydrogenase-like protein